MVVPLRGSAAVERLRLRTELRELRTQAGRTQKNVAQEMEWHPSKLLRIEAGEVGISANDLRQLLSLYGVTDIGIVQRLLDMARASRKMPFAEYRDIFGKDFLDFLAMESSAAVTRSFLPLAVPGLLQTEEYAAAIMRAYTPPELGAEMQRMIEARMLRQDVLDREGAEFFFILDESVICRHVGGSGVMRAQLHRLAELAERPQVNLMIFPFQQGAHPASAHSFTLFEFTDPMPSFVYTENLSEAGVSTAPADAARYLDFFWDLEGKSLKGEVVPEMLLRMAAAMEAEAPDPPPP
ncbi:helix-turn-helix domain-containing protein [Streptomyces phaeochromogenes]|uniref:helix-turn-helix domain-containing protein n=1 Tax=Streptomyces phaeochromogenes TaxID=1923 RepID=UPI003866EFB4|nr:helix-turn-helix domain-containing protein [Streptomyces phaeochromogenes]WSW21088.1 helix-turn-helix domain-containing protein [Streptomyces phaeochromogenes]